MRAGQRASDVPGTFDPLMSLTLSCVDILGNMQSEEWISKLRICGQTERVWAAFQGVRGEGDDVRTSHPDVTDDRSWMLFVF